MLVTEYNREAGPKMADIHIAKFMQNTQYDMNDINLGGDILAVICCADGILCVINKQNPYVLPEKEKLWPRD